MWPQNSSTWSAPTSAHLSDLFGPLALPPQTRPPCPTIDPTSLSLIRLHVMYIKRNLSQALLDSMMSVCGCTGVSGSCATKVCRRIMSPFKSVGKTLKELYHKAVQVSSTKRGRKQIREAKNSISERQLMYIDKSPSFCFADKGKGVLGTSGRVCNITSNNMDSCKLLCCGQGYDIEIKRNVKRCNCKFKWCCNVDCDTCESIDELHTCK